MLTRDVAVELIEQARSSGIEVLGVDGFFLGPKSTQPSMAHSIDLTATPSPWLRARAGWDSWTQARAFIEEVIGADMHVEVVLDDHS